MLQHLDEEMKNFLKFKGYSDLSVKDKLKALLIYPVVLIIYTYGWLQDKFSK